MTIERSFEVITAIPPDDVFEILGRLDMHIPLWSIYESMNQISENEAEVTVRIAGAIYKLKIKMTTVEGKASKTVSIEGQGQIYFHLKLTIEKRGTGSLVTGFVTVKGGFFRERVLSSGVTTFIDDLKNKIMFQIPSIVEALKRKKAVREMVTPPATPKAAEASKAEEKAPEEVKPPKKPEAPAPAPAPTPKKEVKEEKPAPSATPTPKPEAKEKKEEKPKKPPKKKHEGLTIPENPEALSDEVTLGMILLKSEMIDIKDHKGSGKEVEKLLEAVWTEHKDKGILYINVRTKDKLNMKFLIKGRDVIGVRLDHPDEGTINGKEALKKIKDVKTIQGKVYIFKVPPEVLA
ncbi:MAG: hypothetical protein DRO10_02255 [Thermoprotei archaeon]|nr:MAG: hypothetical protein DRO10_02255 [Thermoprotei archaeon]